MDDDDILPRSRIIRVELDIALPVSATKAEILEWLRFELGNMSTLSGDNSLINHEPEALSEPTLTDTGFHLHEDVQFRENGSATIHKWTDWPPFTGRPAMDRVLARHRAKDD